MLLGHSDILRPSAIIAVWLESEIHCERHHLANLSGVLNAPKCRSTRGDMPGDPNNAIVASLPESDRNLLLSGAEVVDIEQRFTFYDPSGPPKHIWFLESGMASELIRISDGR